jgi:phage terminase small subunit
MAPGVPEYPPDLDETGQEMWRRIWSAGLTWISPQSDAWSVEIVCRLSDDLAIARERYRATRDPKDGRMVATFNTELHKGLAELGFNPTARSRLGVAEVKKLSKLEEMMARRAEAQGG